MASRMLHDMYVCQYCKIVYSQTTLQLYERLLSESYTPRTWRTHPLHLCPPEPYSSSDPQVGVCMNWIFLISSLNFSFWSELEGRPERFGISWKKGWGEEFQDETVHTGYWSLVAALDRGMLLCWAIPGNDLSAILFASSRGGHPYHRPCVLCLRVALPH